MTSKRNMFMPVKKSWVETHNPNTPETSQIVKNTVAASSTSPPEPTEEDHKAAREYIKSLPICRIL